MNGHGSLRFLHAGRDFDSPLAVLPKLAKKRKKHHMRTIGITVGIVLYCLTSGSGRTGAQTLSFSSAIILSNGQFQLALHGTTGGQYYTIQYSTNLTDWAPLLTTNAPNASLLYLNFPTTNSCGFYRAYESGIVVSGSVFSFSAPVIPVNVTNGAALITITRTNGLTNAVCVNYSTSDGTASAPCDYTPTSGTLCFSPNVTSNSFSVPISLGCTTNQSATVNLQLSDTNGTVVLNAILVIQRPAPVLAVSPTSLTLLVPENCFQSITISNAGPQGSMLNYTVADDGAFGGYLDFNGVAGFANGSLQAGQTAQIQFFVQEQFATNFWEGRLTTAVDIYTPGAANYVKYPISVTIESDETRLQAVLGTWSGTWAGMNTFYYNSTTTNPVSGSLSVTIMQIDSGASGLLGVSGTITVQGNVYYEYYDPTAGTYSISQFNLNQTIPFTSADSYGYCDGYGIGGISIQFVLESASCSESDECQVVTDPTGADFTPFGSCELGFDVAQIGSSWQLLTTSPNPSENSLFIVWFFDDDGESEVTGYLTGFQWTAE